MKKNSTHILTLDKDDLQKELEFEIAFQLSLTAAQRYKRMKKIFNETNSVTKKRDYTKTAAIVSRT